MLDENFASEVVKAFAKTRGKLPPDTIFALAKKKKIKNLTVNGMTEEVWKARLKEDDEDIYEELEDTILVMVGRQRLKFEWESEFALVPV